MNDRIASPQEIYSKKVRMVNRIIGRMSCGIILYNKSEDTIEYYNQQALDICKVTDAGGLMTVVRNILEEKGSGLFSADVCFYKAEGSEYAQLTVAGNSETSEADSTQNGTAEDSTKERMNEIMSAMASDYTDLFILNAATGSMVTLKSEIAIEHKDVYHDFIEEFLDRICYPDDCAFAREMLTVRQVLTGISYNGKHEAMIHCVDEKSGDIYTKFRFLPGGSENIIVFGIMNVNESVMKERRHQERLRQALEETKAANNAKTVFLSNMSHDIRTPMNAIIGFTDLALKYSDDSGRVTDYLHKIESSGTHLLNLINDILDMSRIESGKMHISEEKADIISILDDVCDMMRPNAERKNISFCTDKSDIRNTLIYCDTLRIKQILINLLSNAIKFTPNGGKVDFTVTERHFVMPGCVSYIFRVKDNGIGISHDFIDKLFVPFERERNSTISGIQGTGLGMSITKSIVDMMGGSISVESEVGQGSDFTVTLGFRMQENFVKDELPENIDGNISGLRILLVEDNMLNREIATELLSEKGADVEIAENGAVAVEMFTARNEGYYDAVLMDVQMPVMNGYEATGKIREIEKDRTVSVPVIAMTANAFEEDRRNAIHAGMNDHIPKPINIDVVARTVVSAIGRSKK